MNPVFNPVDQLCRFVHALTAAAARVVRPKPVLVNEVPVKGAAADALRIQRDDVAPVFEHSAMLPGDAVHVMRIVVNGVIRTGVSCVTIRGMMRGLLSAHRREKKRRAT